MAIADADPKKGEGEETSTGASQHGCASKTNSSHHTKGVIDMSNVVRALRSDPLEPMGFVQHFTVSMPEVWNWENINVFVDCCLENMDDLMLFKEGEDNGLWEKIVELGVQKLGSKNCFGVNDVLELIDCLFDYMSTYSSKMKTNADYKKLRAKITAIDPVLSKRFTNKAESKQDSKKDNSCKLKRGKSLEKMISDPVPAPDLIYNAMIKVSSKYSSKLGFRGSKISALWRKIETELSSHFDVPFGRAESFLELLKTSIIKETRAIEDPCEKVSYFVRRTVGILPYFDLMPPKNLKKSEFLSPAQLLAIKSAHYDNEAYLATIDKEKENHIEQLPANPDKVKQPTPVKIRNKKRSLKSASSRAKTNEHNEESPIEVLDQNSKFENSSPIVTNADSEIEVTERVPVVKKVPRKPVRTYSRKRRRHFRKKLEESEQTVIDLLNCLNDEDPVNSTVEEEEVTAEEKTVAEEVSAEEGTLTLSSAVCQVLNSSDRKRSHSDFPMFGGENVTKEDTVVVPKKIPKKRGRKPRPKPVVDEEVIILEPDPVGPISEADDGIQPARIPTPPVIEVEPEAQPSLADESFIEEPPTNQKSDDSTTERPVEETIEPVVITLEDPPPPLPPSPSPPPSGDDAPTSSCPITEETPATITAPNEPLTLPVTNTIRHKRRRKSAKALFVRRKNHVRVVPRVPKINLDVDQGVEMPEKKISDTVSSQREVTTTTKATFRRIKAVELIMRKRIRGSASIKHIAHRSNRNHPRTNNLKPSAVADDPIDKRSESEGYSSIPDEEYQSSESALYPSKPDRRPISISSRKSKIFAPPENVRKPLPNPNISIKKRFSNSKKKNEDEFIIRCNYPIDIAKARNCAVMIRKYEQGKKRSVPNEKQEHIHKTMDDIHSRLDEPSSSNAYKETTSSRNVVRSRFESIDANAIPITLEESSSEWNQQSSTSLLPPVENSQQSSPRSHHHRHHHHQTHMELPQPHSSRPYHPQMELPHPSRTYPPQMELPKSQSYPPQMEIPQPQRVYPHPPPMELPQSQPWRVYPLPPPMEVPHPQSSRVYPMDMHQPHSSRTYHPPPMEPHPQQARSYQPQPMEPPPAPPAYVEPSASYMTTYPVENNYNMMITPAHGFSQPEWFRNYVIEQRQYEMKKMHDVKKMHFDWLDYESKKISLMERIIDKFNQFTRE